MSKNIIYCNVNSSIKEVSILMKDNNIGFIPIKDKDKFVGVITDRDICLSLGNIKSINDCVRSFMTNSIICIDLNSSVDEALNLMSKYKIKRLLVKEKDNIIGILSLSDILNNCKCENILDTYRSIFYIHDNNINELPTIDEFYM